MKKTYNINLAGVVFTMDEDAYDLLNDYLDTLQHAFRKEEDYNEIVKDIESRAAELLIEMLGENRQVVSLSDIEAVINRIGRPEEMIEEEIHEEVTPEGVEERIEVENIGVTPPPIIPRGPIHKKLFRDPQNAMIGGVCAGFAAYLNIDVTWVRLFTVAISLLSVSTAAIVYLILWIVLPEARTPLERMQMNGEAPTMANIGRTVTNTFRGENQEMRNYEDQNRTGFKRFLDSMVKIFGTIAKIILVALLIIGFPVLFALAVALIACIFALILFSTSLGAALWENVPLNVFGDGVEEPILGILCAIGVIIAIGLPIFALIWIVLFKSHPMTSGWKKTLITTWIIGFILAAVTTGIIAVRTQTHDWRENLRNIPDIQNIDETIEEETIEDDDSIITITKGKGYEITKQKTDSTSRVTIKRGGETLLQVNGKTKE